MKKAKPRNGGTWTEARYWQQVRSHLRNGFRYWKPIAQCKEKARRPNRSENKRLKWEFQCKDCKQWFPDKQVQVDHIIEAGTLKCAEDLVGFLERLTAEGEEDYQLLCKPCHQTKTNKERKNK
ncbi:MAG: hypothetical protein GQ474_07925 [Sulfurimonas sp.]|nr:hypothetical protein [Sulfurimonas sp.]